MKYLAVIILLFSTAAFAGENRNNSQNASARAAALAVGVGIAGAKGGTATASGDSGDSLYLSIPGAASVGAAGAHPCGLSTGWSIPIFTYNSVEMEPFCALAKQADWVCRRAVRNASLSGRCSELTLAAANYGKAAEVVATKASAQAHTASSGGKDKDDLACVLGWGLKHLDC